MSGPLMLGFEINDATKSLEGGAFLGMKHGDDLLILYLT